MMQSILYYECLHAHNQDEAWWFKVKMDPKADADMLLLPLNEAPAEYCLSKLLGISMHNLLQGHTDQFLSLPKMPEEFNYHKVREFFQNPVPKKPEMRDTEISLLSMLPEQSVGCEVDMYEILESLHVDNVIWPVAYP
jgi:hypothetical protein